MHEIVDIFLVIIIGAISLVATLLIPSDEKIQKNEAAKYKSNRIFIYAVGGSALFIGILLLILYAADANYQKLVNILKVAFFVIIGIALIARNVKKSKFLEKVESGAIPIATEGTIVEATAMVGGQPFPQQQIQAQQIGIKATPAVQPQPQVQAQQIGIKATPTVKPQPQVQTGQVAVQQPQPTTAPKPQSKIVVIKCPKCQGSMQIDLNMKGQKMKCPHCGVEGRIG